MAYIGRGTDKISNIEKLDTITFDGSSSYTLQKNSVNFTPNSANSLQVSIDGVVQAGNFTVSGSTIDFGVAIPATSTNDFIFHYGTGLVTTVADGAITTAKLGDASVTSAKLDSGVALGKVLQVVQSTSTGVTSTTSSSFVDTGLSGSITPSSASNKILILISAQLGNTTAAANNQARIIRGATEIITFSRVSFNAAGHSDCQNSYIYLDSPSTTSSTTYKLQYATNTGTFRFNDESGGTSNSTITLMEIAG